MISEPPYAPLRRRLGWSTVAVLLAALFQLLRAGNFPVEVAARQPPVTATQAVTEPTLGASVDSSGAPEVARVVRVDGRTRPVPGSSSTRQRAITAAARQASGPRNPASMDMTLRPPHPGRYL